MKSWLERLEISVVPLAQTLHPILRFDAEYYSHENLRMQERIATIAGQTIQEAGGILDCSAFYPSITSAYSNDHTLVPFLRVNELVNGLVSLTSNTVFLPQTVLDKNAKTIAIAYPGDIVLAKGGNTLAKVGLVTEEYPAYATCRDVIILRTHQLKGIGRYFLWAFLHSKYGQAMMWRAATQTGQPHLTLTAIANLHIPHASMVLQDAFEKIYTTSVAHRLKAQAFYQKAKSLLEQAMDLEQKEIAKQQISVRSLNEILSAGRIDAEYYQPKYDAILQQLARISDGTIGTRCSIYDQNFTPDAATTYRYIELADIGNQGIITGCTTDTGDNLPTRARRIVHTGNLLVPSIEGSLQSMALVSDAYDSALCSTGFFVLDADDINSETLLVLFKSAPMQALLKRQCAGTILTGFDKDALCSIPLPVIPLDVQKQIQASVRQSFELRAQAVTLLATARRAVECFIEQGEAAALAVLASDSEA